MQKQSFISFIFILTFWIVISAATSLEHIIVGIILAVGTVWFWHDLSPRLPGIMSPRELLTFARCMLMLVGYVIQSNITVINILLLSNQSVRPIFLELEPGIESNWGRVLLATCITITPGTVTIDFDPETNIFTVHALTRKIGVDLLYWRLISEIRNLEALVRRRRRTYVVDTGRIHVSNPICATKSDHRPHRD